MTFYCQACGTPLTRAEADYHRSECHAFVDQTRGDIAEEKRLRLTAEPDEPPEQSSQDERP